MPRAELHLTVPDDVWIGELSRRYPEALFSVLSALPDQGSGVGLVEITSEHLPTLLEAVRGYESVTNLDVLSHHGETALLQFETTSPLLLTAVQDSGIPLEMPFDLVDGEATWEITAPQDALSTLGRQLEEFGIPFHVERIEQTVQPDQLLTDTQRALLTTAVELGYYDTPRECSLTELADEMGLAKSTCSETLHRAEERVVKTFLDGAASSVRATA
jgi:hypothetical protein